MGSDFLAHLSLTDRPAFILWAVSYPYIPNTQEVKALSFLPDYAHIALKAITKVLWSMVYVLKGGSLLCPDVLAPVLQLVDPVLHQPPDSVYPIKITSDEDLCSQAWESWEEILSWIQYWWKEDYMARNPPLFYGGNLRTDMPMVLFVLHHINQVLLESKPIWLEAILANTRWDPALATLQETDLAEVHHWLEKELPLEEINIPTREYLCEHAVEVTERNYKLHWEVVRDADRWREQTIWKGTKVREQRCQKEKQQRQNDLELHHHNWWKDKEHAATVAKAKTWDQEAMPPPAIPPHLPPQEKTLTTTMPHSSTPSVPVSICCPEATPPRTLSFSKSLRPIGVSSLSPSPIMTRKEVMPLDSLDSADIADPLQQFWKHYLPDEAKMEDTKEDSWTILEMELEYTGVTSTWEDWRKGEYGDVPTYHTVPSPPGVNEDDDGMLEGSMAEVSPEIEAALLRLDNAGKDRPTRSAVTVQEEYPTTEG